MKLTFIRHSLVILVVIVAGCLPAAFSEEAVVDAPIEVSLVRSGLNNNNSNTTTQTACRVPACLPALVLTKLPLSSRILVTVAFSLFLLSVYLFFSPPWTQTRMSIFLEEQDVLVVVVVVVVVVPRLVPRQVRAVVVPRQERTAFLSSHHMVCTEPKIAAGMVFAITVRLATTAARIAKSTTMSVAMASVLPRRRIASRVLKIACRTGPFAAVGARFLLRIRRRLLPSFPVDAVRTLVRASRIARNVSPTFVSVDGLLHQEERDFGLSV